MSILYDVLLFVNLPIVTQFYCPYNIAFIKLSVWHGNQTAAISFLDADINNKTFQDALEAAKRYFATSKECQKFVDENLHVIVKLLLSQSRKDLSRQPDKFGLSEDDYAEKSIRFALQLINLDLNRNAHKFTLRCNTLKALAIILSYDNKLYEESPVDFRMEKIMVFQRSKGFKHLSIYYNARSGIKFDPNWTMVRAGIEAAHEGLVFLQHEQEVEFMGRFRKDAMNMACGIMKLLSRFDDDALANIDVDRISKIISELGVLFENLALVDKKAMSRYFSFCQDMSLKILSIESNAYKEYGQSFLYDLIKVIYSIRPLTGGYVVKRAGVSACDGMYAISSFDRDKDGYVVPGLTPRYERTVKPTNQKLMLFLDTEQHPNLWCLSEEHGDDAIVSEYTDYYTNTSSSRTPPLSGWISGESNGQPPSLEPLATTIPVRKEHKNLKSNLAKWFLEKNIIKLVLGADIDSSSDEESVAKLVEAIDAFVDMDVDSDKMTNIYLSILPSISSSTPCLPQSTSKAFSNDILAIEAAKERVASAERWKDTTSKMLLSAKKEDDAALKILHEARQHLAGLEGTEMTKSSDISSRAPRSKRETAMKTEQNVQPSEVAGRLKKSNSFSSLSTTGSKAKEHSTSSRKKKSSKKQKSNLTNSFNSSLDSISDFRKLLNQQSTVFGRQSSA